MFLILKIQDNFFNYNKQVFLKKKKKEKRTTTIKHALHAQEKLIQTHSN